MGGLFDDFGIGDGLKLAAGGLDLFGNFQKQQNKQGDQGAMIDFLRQKSAYDQSQAQADYDWQMQAYGQSQANAAARAAAARANEAARLAASRKGQKALERGYKQTLGMYDPFVKSAHSLLPQMQGMYGMGSKGLQSLFADVSSMPMNQSVPSWMTGVPLPKSMKVTG